jgi:hypothetical protein
MQAISLSVSLKDLSPLKKQPLIHLNSYNKSKSAREKII